MIRIGEYSLWIALAAAVWALAASVRDVVRPPAAAKGAEGAERALYLSGVGVATATGVLVFALLSGELSLQYVAALSAGNVPVPYRVAALWAAPSGAMLIAALALTGVTPIALRSRRLRRTDATSWVIVVVSLVLVMMLAPLVTRSGLFARLDFVPAEGLGLDPRLQVPEMLVYAPALLTGLAASVIATAAAIAGIASGRLDGAWLAIVRRWTTIAWALATVALWIGLEWSFGARAGVEWRGESLRSGMLTAWMVISAALLAIVLQERRGAAYGWTSSLSLAGTVAIAIPALVTRNIAGPSAVDFLARPAGNWSLIFSAILIGYVGYIAASVRVVRFAPRLPWSRTRRAPFIAMTAVGAAFVMAGLIGASRATRSDVTVADGASVEVRDAFGAAWTFASSGTSVFKFKNRFTTATALVPSRGSSRKPLLRTETREFLSGDEQSYGEPMSVPGISRTILEDAVVVLRAAPPGRAMLTIAFVPLASFTWIGGALLLFGVVMATRGTNQMSEHEAEDPAEAAVKRWRTRKAECPDCGPRPESVALFCSNCGRFLERECPSCHAAVHSADARYCENCGAGFAG